MIVVDTSVWIAALRGKESVAQQLRDLVLADEVTLALPVRLELRAGAARAKRKALLEGLSGLPVARPTEDTWHTLEQWTDRAADAGQYFDQSDLLIAALADELGALVWTLDKDFERMEKLKFVRLHS